MLVRFSRMCAGSGVTPFFQPRYCSIASPAATVGQKATLCSFISLKTSGVPSSPCSIVSTPARIARRIPSALVAWAETGRPASCAALTAAAISSCEKVGREGSPGPQR